MSEKSSIEWTEKGMREIDIAVAFGLVADLAHALGARGIKDLPGCWERQVDQKWWIAVNAHEDATKCSKGTAVLKFHCYVEFNGWPAGMFSPAGGVIAHGAAANERLFCAALRRAIAKAERENHGEAPDQNALRSSSL